MKIKDLILITLKIIGLIAFWKAVQTFGAVITGIGIFSSLIENNDQMNTPFMIAIGLAMILNFLLPLIVAILFLFRTEKVFVTNTQNKSINYFALIEIIPGINLLTNATEIAKKIERNFDSKTGRLTEETNN